MNKRKTQYTLKGTRFGDLQYEKDDVLSFPEGIIGFWQLTEFVLLNPKADGQFRWLQSTQEPSLAFLLTDPTFYLEEYSKAVGDLDLAELGIDGNTPYMVMVTASIPKGDPQGMTINLAAPVVINVASRKGAQILLDNPAYTIKHRAFADAEREKVA